MAVSKLGMLDARIAAEDLSEKVHYVAVLDTAGQVAVAGDGAMAYGIIVEAAAAGDPATVQLDGLAKVIFGGTVDENDRVASDANGKIVTAASGDFVIGVCRNGGAVNEIGTIDLRMSAAKEA